MMKIFTLKNLLPFSTRNSRKVPENTKTISQKIYGLKHFWLAVLLLFSAVVHAQVTGDYRSAATGNWTTLTTWQRYNGTAWVTPTAGQGYPGQFTGTGTVTILNGNNVTLNSTIPTAFTALLIGDGTTTGTLTISANSSLLTSRITVKSTGIISFTGNFDLQFPANSVFIVESGGNLNSGGGPCNSQKSIRIGTTVLSTCNGNSTAYSFAELMASGGFVAASPSYNSTCIGSTLQLFANRTGGLGPFTFSWTGPNGFTSTLANPTISNVTAAAAGTYTVTVNDNNFSPALTNTNSVTVTLNPAPTLTAVSQAAAVCAGTGATINLTGLLANSTSTINYSIGGVVQTPVTGVVANASGAASFTSAALTAANNGQTLLVTSITTTSSTPNCTATVSQSATLSVNALPQGTLTANGPFCTTGTGQLTFTATAGTGPFTVVYNDGVANRTATNVTSGVAFDVFTNPVTATTTYTLVSVAGQFCTRSSGFTGGSATITVNPLPQGSLTANGPICGSGTGQLTFTATAGTGPFTIVYNDGVANRTATNVSSGVAFNAFTNPVSSTTTYTLVSVTGQFCSRSSGFTAGSATITVNPLPQGSLTANGPFCATGTGRLTFTATAGTGPFTVVYNDGVANRTATNVTSGVAFDVFTNPVVSTTTYTLVSVTGQFCSRSSGFTAGSATITVNPLPQGTLSANGPFCGPGTGQLTFTSTAGTAPFTIVYNDGVADRTVNNVSSGVAFNVATNPVSNTTTYTLVSVTGQLCSRTSGFTGGSATITINQPSTAPTGSSGNVTICNGNSTSLSLTGGTLGGGTIEWFTGSCGGTLVGTGNNFSVSPSTTTTYYGAYRNSAACGGALTACQTIVVTVSQPSTAPTGSSGNVSICSGGSTSLSLTGGSLGSGTIEWYTGSCGGTLVGTGNNFSVSASATTTYYGGYRNSATCGGTLTACQTIVVTVSQPSTAPTGSSGNTTICNGNSTSLSLTGGTLGGGTIEWFTGSCGGTLVGTGNNFSVSPSTTTTYYGAYRNSAACGGALTACQTIVVTVSQPSTAPTGSSGNVSICSGGSTSLSLTGGSLGSGTIEWYTGSCGGTLVGTGNNFSVSPSSTTTYYGGYRNSATCGGTLTACQTIVVTVSQPSTAPTGSSGNTTICNGNSTSLSLTGGTLGGGTIEWFTGSCGGTLVGTGNNFSVSPSTTTTYYGAYRNSAACGGALTACQTITITVNTSSTAPAGISGNTAICSGGSTTLTVNGGVAGTGAVTQWFTGSCGGTPAGTGSSITVSPTSNTTYFVRYSGTCNTTTCASATVTVSANNLWVGGGSNLWSDGTQWSCGTKPISTQNISLSGTPILDENFTVAGSLLLSAGLTSFTINPNVVLSISGTADFGNRPVIVKSTAAGTGAIGAITGTLSNASNVTVERFIPARRAWRLVSAPPVTGTQTLKEAWSNNRTISDPSQAAAEPPGIGTLITGHGYTSPDPGYDFIGPSLMSSIRKYQFTPTGGGWPSTVANTPSRSTTLSAAAADRAYLLFVRGDRTVTLGTPNTTTLYPTGSLRIGQQTVNVYPSGTGKYAVMGNPYASTIDFESVMNNAGNSSVANPERLWIWNPTVTPFGGYNLAKKVAGQWYLVPSDFDNNPGTANANARYIQSGQGFFVEPTATGGVLSFVETNKANPTGPLPTVFSPMGMGQVFANLYYDLSSGLALSDGVLAVFGDGNSLNVSDENDVAKAINLYENFGLNRNGVQLTMEAHPPLVDSDTLYFQLSGTTARNYALRLMAVDMPANTTALLIDNYLGKEMVVGMMDSVKTTYKFSVTSDVASAAADRFKLIFKTGQILPLTLTSAKAFQLNREIQVEWQTSNENSMKEYVVEKSTDGRLFTALGTVVAQNVSSAGYSLLDAHPVAGNNFYRIKGIATDGKLTYSQILLVRTGQSDIAGFTIYPNPVKNSRLGIQLTNLDKGNYTLSIFNQAGQKIAARSIIHLGGSASEEIQLEQSVGKGIYRVGLTNGQGFISYQNIIVQ